MATLTNGLSWQPAPVPGTIDRYSVEPRESFEAADWRYRLSLDYDSAVAVASILSEIQQEIEYVQSAADADIEAADELRREAESERDEADTECERLRERVAELEEQLASAEEDAEELRADLDQLTTQLANEP